MSLIVWGSTFAVAAALGLVFSVQSVGKPGMTFSYASAIAFIVGFVATRLFWLRIFKLADQPKKLRRFVILSVTIFVGLFVSCIFLPQFGGGKRDVVMGVILGFCAVALFLSMGRCVVKLFEPIESPDESTRENKN
jgi:hypothetical protein